MSESIASGTYEVLRNRLREAATDLRERFDRLNSERSAVFGNIETHLRATVHVTTDHNCVPRDLISVGEYLLLGYNVQFGLKNEVRAEDVFSLYKLTDDVAHPIPLNKFFTDAVRRDFEELYRYYKNTVFSRFFVSGPNVYLIFQVGKTSSDIKAFKFASDVSGLRYVDNRSDHEVRFPDQHAFRWLKATRDQHRSGAHPHISIGDIVFVECVGGDLTIKVEDNTEDGSGIYSEPVDHPDQTLDDAEIFYCILGNLVLLKMRPYQEKDFRHLIYSSKRQSVTRVDAISRACVLLPDDQGIIFPGGVFLQTGTYKVIDHGLGNLIYERTVAAPNGEDYLYLFNDPSTGTFLQLRYNLIRQEVDTPTVCHGQALFEDGSLVTFRAQEQPQKHHALQVWTTPFVGPNHRVEVNSDSMLFKIGNRDLVRGMAECQEVLQLIDKDESYADLYLDLVKRSTAILDSYFWLNHEETMRLDEPMVRIRDTANAAVDEYDKVVRVRKDTESATRETQTTVQELLAAIGRASFDSVEQFVEKLGAIRTQRGIALGLRDRKFIDETLVDNLDASLVEASERLGQRCVQFLLTGRSLEPYRIRIHDASDRLPAVHTAAAGRKMQEELEKIGSDLELLIETVSQLKIDDLTRRTEIVDRTGNLLAELNRVRSQLKTHVRELLSAELEADFSSQMKLLDQAAAGALDTAESPDKVDGALARMMLQLEELEGRFAEADDLLGRLTEKRQSLYEAFEARRQQLVEARSRRADSLASAAERLLQGILSRANRMSDAAELRSYFASDPMVDKVRQLAGQLSDLGDSVRSEDLMGRLKSLSDTASRQLQDRQELFADGGDLIRLGKYQFSVNKQPIELTTIVRGDALFAHLTGTKFYQPLIHADLQQARDLWGQALVSESPSMYRGEYLAMQCFEAYGVDGKPLGADAALDFVRQTMQERHDEGYARGVHDSDAAKILQAVIDVHGKLSLLRYSPKVRGHALYAWTKVLSDIDRNRFLIWIHGFADAAKVIPQMHASKRYIRQLYAVLKAKARRLFDNSDLLIEQAAEYLFESLRSKSTELLVSSNAYEFLKHLDEHLPLDQRKQLRSTLRASTRPLDAWTLAIDVVDGAIKELHYARQDDLDSIIHYRAEIAALLLAQDDQPLRPLHAQPTVVLEGLVGDHPRIVKGAFVLHYHQMIAGYETFKRQVVPRFRALVESKRTLIHALAKQLGIEEFKAKVLTSFVRNRLIDEVYLPLIGDNLAKQIGAAGAGKRSDRMGLLLLISPPGYGKTTLMEYVANRLGLVFVKVNGPALGHSITSLDPNEATNVASREEVKKINMALEMGDNVMLYLDDIQHCNPELLQKFIPLCDATRRIEGVWDGQSRTYDLRGRKVAVVMAGNPYTESGDKFQIPDMLANRADVYNLGEIIGDSREAFELSYLENCLMSNPVLQTLARASSKDQRAVIRAAEIDSLETLELQSNIDADALNDMLSVLKKLLKVRDIILRVNRNYIRSAAQVDAYRTEPPFKLQGSYRNMNRIAERVVPVMNDAELMTLVVSNYEQDSQTLTRDGESNLLKFKEIVGILSDEESERWEKIKYAYTESVRMQGVQGDDQVALVLRSLMGIRDGLESIRQTMLSALANNPSERNREVIEAGVARLSGSLTSMSERLSDTLGSIASRVEGAQQKPTDQRMPEQRVLVQHSVPRVMTELVQSQFQLLYDGLKPLLESNIFSQTEMSRLRTSIDNCLQRYREVQAEIDAGQAK